MSDLSQQTKTCTSCLVTKPVSEYYKLKGGKYGVRAKCVECSRADARMHQKETYVPVTVQNISDEELFVLSRQFLTERIAAGAVPEETFVKGTPHPKQKLFLDIEHDEALKDQKIIEVLFGGSVGGGKGLLLSTPILTANKGWTTIGELVDGDQIYDEQGKVCNVTKAHDPYIPKRLFKLKFDTGQEIVADGDHLWLTYDTNERHSFFRSTPEALAARRAKRPSRAKPGTSTKKLAALLKQNQKLAAKNTKGVSTGTVRDTVEIFDTQRKGPRQNVNHSIPVTKSLDIPEADLPLHPYILGSFLGDGCRSDGSICGAIDDVAILANYIESLGLECRIKTIKTKHNDLSYLYVEGLKEAIKDLDLVNKKYFPEQYLYGSYEQRLEVVRGLFDTDGTVDKEGRVRFSNTNKDIVDGLVQICRSLGWKCTYTSKVPTISGKPCVIAYTVYVTPTEYVFHLPRKREKQKLASGKYTKMHYIRDVEEIVPEMVRCITVDSPSRLYLASESMIPTHNTWTLLAAALKYVHVPGYSALLLRKSFPDLAQEGGLMALSKEWLSGTAAKWNETSRTWTFPSGASLRFGYLETESDKFRYLGGEYQFVGWDELTQHHESAYKFLFSRVRKRADIPVPLRVMGATNPGNIGGKWVYERFIPIDFSPASARERDVWYKEHPSVIPGDPPHITAFIPSMLDDNPSLDREAYLQSLMQLDEITRQQYLSGDWQIQVRGDILYTYSEAHTVISWSQFEKVIGQRKIPGHWKTGVYLDAGTTEGHPNITSWFATAANNAPTVNGVPIAGKVFLYRGHMTTQTSAREMSGIIADFMREEKSQCVSWQMSHEASSERIEFNKQGLPFAAWKTGRTRGIEQLKNAFSLTNTDKPNPFKPELKGCPQLFLIVDDRELVHAQTDRGLARWREEILAYHWNTLKSGEPTTRLVPYPLFNDAVDTMRAAAADYWPVATQKTLHEKVADAVEEIQPKDFVESITDPTYKSHVLSQRHILAEQARARLKEVDTILADWQQIG